MANNNDIAAACDLLNRDWVFTALGTGILTGALGLLLFQAVTRCCRRRCTRRTWTPSALLSAAASRLGAGDADVHAAHFRRGDGPHGVSADTMAWVETGLVSPYAYTPIVVPDHEGRHRQWQQPRLPTPPSRPRRMEPPNRRPRSASYANVQADEEVVRRPHQESHV